MEGLRVALTFSLLIAAIPFGAATPVDDHLGWGIHPGSKVFGTGVCTVSFLVKNVMTSKVGFLTAGRCFDAVGDEVYVQKDQAAREDDASRSAGHAAALAACPTFDGRNLAVPDCLNAHFGPTFGIVSDTQNDIRLVGHVVAREHTDTHGKDYALVEITDSGSPRMAMASSFRA